MPSETLWMVIDPVLEAPDLANADGVQPDGVVMRSTSKTAALAYAGRRNNALNRRAAERRCQVVEYVRKDVADAEAQRLREDVAALRAAVALHAQTLDHRALGRPDFVKRDRDSIDNDLYNAVRARDPRWWDREVPGLAACSEGDNA